MNTLVHPHFSREERTDPITGNTIDNTEGHPWLQEGDPDNGLTIYFENENSMNEYIAIKKERPEQDLRKTLSNDIDESWDEG